MALAWLIWGASAAPGWALQADPRRSHVDAQAPALAPNVWGRAPLVGATDRAGRIQLWASASSIQTGNVLYDAFLRRALAPRIAVFTSPVGNLERIRGGQRRRVDALAQVGPAALELPLTLRLRGTTQGLSLNTYVTVPLAPFGVVNPLGGTPGQVRVAVSAYFPHPSQP
ncbi:MAG: hypothetical protein VKP62_06720 [Candidatus Sericytochromatia bacterium]|nr:hypothetical protein [Candidatus Sericytochromatia bacterium]